MNYNVKESGKRIKELRKAKGYTQESFAEELNISHRTYSGIELGNSRRKERISNENIKRNSGKYINYAYDT